MGKLAVAYPPEVRFMDIREVCYRLNCSRSQLYGKYIKKGLIKPISCDRRVRFFGPQVMDVIKEEARKAGVV